MGARLAAVGVLVLFRAVVAAQEVAGPGSGSANDYVIGPHDVLIVTSYDQRDLTGKFAVEADGTFTFPLLGRVAAAGLTLRQAEAALRQGLVERGIFTAPQLSVAVDEYRSQKIFILGEVRRPGVYTLSGAMRLVEALALADAALPTARDEIVIVPAASHGSTSAPGVVRVDLRALESGDLSHNVALKAGDTILVPRVENIYVFGQVRNPGAYPLSRKDMTVLQALSLAGGVTDRGAAARVRIARRADDGQRELKVQPTDVVMPGDTIIVPERFF